MTDPNEQADSDWLEKRGFQWSACGTAMYRYCGTAMYRYCGTAMYRYCGQIEVLVTGDVCFLEKPTGLSLYWSYSGPPKVSLAHLIDDNPTRQQVSDLCKALGYPLEDE